MDNRSKIFVDDSNNVIDLEPVIPDGYDYFEGDLENGFVIERISDHSQFVWIPVKRLINNGTMDNKNFSEQFGRRNFYNWKLDEFLSTFDEMNPELESIIKSVKKYGGFYISRYKISDILGNEKPRSVFSRHPWVHIPFYVAKQFASSFSTSKKVYSHLPYGCEYDSILQWQLQTLKENCKNSNSYLKMWRRTCLELINSRSSLINNIDDFAWRYGEWTQESTFEKEYKVVRAGLYEPELNFITEPGSRIFSNKNYGYLKVGFRIALTLV